jgi:sulfur-oxidizing protein SoxZ
MPDIKIRAKLSGDETVVKCLMSHPMENGQRKDSQTNEPIPAHFIKEVVCKWKDQVVLTALWSGGVSKNPYLAFKIKGGAIGDKIQVSWTDNQGGTQSATAEIAA